MGAHALALESGECYVAVAASQTEAVLTERVGTIIKRLIIFPTDPACGVVTLHDGKGTGNTDLFTWPGGVTTALLEELPIVLELGIRAVDTTGTLTSEGWCVTTGANLHVLAVVQKL